MDIRQKTIKLINEKKFIKSSDLVDVFGVSRQYVGKLLKILVNSGEIIKIGSTKSAQYTLPKFLDELSTFKISKHFSRKGLKEHEVIENLIAYFPTFHSIQENVQSIIRYAFSEMLNNAIEHSQSKSVDVEIMENHKIISFIVNDFGIGVFNNVMKKRKLKSLFEAMQDLLKGKTTTAPKAHSGEGIFFTSKVADRFILESFDKRMRVDNIINDVFFEQQKPSKTGTRVIFSIAKKSKRHLNSVFNDFQSEPDSYAFDKTEIRVRLFTMGTIYISRSQARRILVGLEKFNSILLDFDHVPTIGQSFADEIFRVFKNKYPKITIATENMNEAVKFMIERAKNEANRTRI